MNYLIREKGGARKIHVKNCPIANKYGEEGFVEIQKINPKSIICKTCENMVYIVIGLKDNESYKNNFHYLKKWFQNIDSEMLKTLIIDKHVKLKIIQQRMYFLVGDDWFYVDFSIYDASGTVNLYHNNYNRRVRYIEEKELALKSSFHLQKENIFVKDALTYLRRYKSKKNAVYHKKQLSVTPFFTENDPEYWGV